MGVPIEFEKLRKGTELVKRGFASMQKGGVIMDVVKPEQARIAEDAGAVAVMALEAVPSDIRKEGGVARMADPEIVKSIIEEVSIPVQLVSGSVPILCILSSAVINKAAVLASIAALDILHLVLPPVPVTTG